ncbi:MAG: hypothetical protein NTV66_12960 [Methylococcales bacterium]|nr:hypothetical protein [Methylococcales bacterium]
MNPNNKNTEDIFPKRPQNVPSRDIHQRQLYMATNKVVLYG